jgi:DNA-binding response OmpR family regulator
MDPPRVLIVMAAQWPRALLRAALRQEGYDALGARDLGEALSYPAVEENRGPVRLLILDQEVLEGNDQLLAELLERHHDALTLVLASAFRPSVQGAWPRVLRHPVAIADIIKTTQELLPLSSAAVHPID